MAAHLSKKVPRLLLAKNNPSGNEVGPKGEKVQGSCFEEQREIPEMKLDFNFAVFCLLFKANFWPLAGPLQTWGSLESAKHSAWDTGSCSKPARMDSQAPCTVL